MLPVNSSLELELPELPYGLVWLIGASDTNPSHLTPLGLQALGTADAVIHDPEVSQKLLDLVKPPRYREPCAPHRAIQRAIKLAEDGWRVVHLIQGNTMERAVESAIRCAERNIAFRIVPNTGEPIGGEATLGLVLVHPPLSVGQREADPVLVLITNTLFEAMTHCEPRQAPLSFSMSGLAG